MTIESSRRYKIPGLEEMLSAFWESQPPILMRAINLPEMSFSSAPLPSLLQDHPGPHFTVGSDSSTERLRLRFYGPCPIKLSLPHGTPPSTELR